MDVLNLLPVCALYPEIHYTFRTGFSLLKKWQPEILADVPFRVDPNEKIPVLCLFKDSCLYPTQIKKIEICLSSAHHSSQYSFPILHQLKRDQFFSKIFWITPPEKDYGFLTITVDFYLKGRFFHYHIRNDNFRFLSHAPFTVYRAKDKLPADSQWYYGDAHAHSAYTNDQVEFGAPLTDLVLISKAAGLAWIGITDHSYDLDDALDNPLRHDPSLPKWHQFLEEVKHLNSNHEVLLIPGEEISCGNVNRKNIHVLAYNLSHLIPGFGDSGEVYFQNAPTLPLSKVLERVQEQNGLAFASHPQDDVRWPESYVLRRQAWQDQDLVSKGLTGIQIWNGKHSGHLRKHLKKWTDLLLHGKKLVILGGNDSHGNFNRSRKVTLPLFKLAENQEQIFGKVRTCAYVPEFNLKNLLRAIQLGNTLVTDGPFVTFRIGDGSRSANLGESLNSKEILKVQVRAISTEEFGKIKQIQLILGDLNKKQEKVLKNWEENELKSSLKEDYSLALPPIEFSAYLRLEAVSQKDLKIHYCITNPIWLNDFPNP